MWPIATVTDISRKNINECLRASRGKRKMGKEGSLGKLTQGLKTKQDNENGKAERLWTLYYVCLPYVLRVGEELCVIGLEIVPLIELHTTKK